MFNSLKYRKFFVVLAKSRGRNSEINERGVRVFVNEGEV